MRNVSEKQTNLMQPKKPSEKKDYVTIQSRFGELIVDPVTKILFEFGILGLPSAMSFCLAELPGRISQFKLLQCLEDHDLSFLVIPADIENQVVSRKDLEDACGVLDIEIENLLVLFIVTVYFQNGQQHVSINAKAPVLVDVETKKAAQYVLQNAEYDIQHRIS